MQPAFEGNKRKKISNMLVIIAISLAVLIIVILVVGSMADNVTPVSETNIAADSATPYGTEYITPFYTPTLVPTIDPATVNTPVPTPAPTPTMVPLVLDAMYKKGDSGDEILIIQKMLMDIGFDPGTTDGDFGSALVNTAKNFQLYEDLDDDGIIGPTTISYIISNWQQMYPTPLDDKLPLYGIIIGIDAGHQQKSNSNTEPISPNSSDTKSKTSSGTVGTWSDVDEYVLNLLVALRLQNELEALGATVIMTRENHNVDISNVERAQMMNDSDVECWLRIHANGSTDADTYGMFMLIPDDNCMDTKDTRVYEKGLKLANTLLNNTLQTTGAKSLGVVKRNDLTGFNWSQVPVCLIEMGHMTNESEDKLLVTKAYQQKIIDGLVNGFLEYFNAN